MSALFRPDLESGDLPFSLICNAGAVAGSEAFLLQNGSVSFLFDSGFGCCGDLLVQRLEEILDGRPLDYIFLSHSHYDHAPGSAWCKARWPFCRVIAGRKTQSVFRRPGAIATMRRLDLAASAKFGIRSSADRFDELNVDAALDDGESITAGDQTVRLLLLPGHTNCSVGFWFPSCGLLLASESLGVLYDGTDRIGCALLTGFSAGLQSIRRCLALPVRHLFIPHCGMVHGDDCRLFLESALESDLSARSALLAAHENGAGREALRSLLKDMWYVGRIRDIQPEEAFDENSGYIVDTILREHSFGAV